MSNIPDNVIIDDCDREYLESFGKWYVSGKGYAVRNTGRDPSTKKQRTIRMHRVILERKLGRPIAPGMVADHRDRNKLNNSQLNLREVTPQHNSWNRRCRNYRWHPTAKAWEVRVTVDGQYCYGGMCATESEAAAAAEELKARLHVIP